MGRGGEGGAEGRQGRVIDRGWKGWRYDAPGDVIARYNPLQLPAGALSFTTLSLVCCLALCAIHLIPSAALFQPPLSNQLASRPLLPPSSSSPPSSRFDSRFFFGFT